MVKSWFANASIRQKLTVLMTLSTTLMLLIAGLALGTYEVITFRRELVQKLTTVADIVGRNSTAALAFSDSAVAQDILSALAAGIQDVLRERCRVHRPIRIAYPKCSVFFSFPERAAGDRSRGAAAGRYESGTPFEAPFPA